MLDNWMPRQWPVIVRTNARHAVWLVRRWLGHGHTCQYVAGRCTMPGMHRGRA